MTVDSLQKLLHSLCNELPPHEAASRAAEAARRLGYEARAAMVRDPVEDTGYADKEDAWVTGVLLRSPGSRQWVTIYTI